MVSKISIILNSSVYIKIQDRNLICRKDAKPIYNKT